VFVLDKSFTPGMLPTRVKYLTVPNTMGSLLALPENIRPTKKNVLDTNTLAYFAEASVSKKNVLWHWHQVSKASILY